MTKNKVMTKQESKTYIEKKLEELPFMIRSFALGRLNKRAKTELINLLLLERSQKK